MGKTLHEKVFGSKKEKPRYTLSEHPWTVCITITDILPNNLFSIYEDFDHDDTYNGYSAKVRALLFAYDVSQKGYVKRYRDNDEEVHYPLHRIHEVKALIDKLPGE